MFNVGEYRRIAAPLSISNSDFFRPDNKDGQEMREYVFAWCDLQANLSLCMCMCSIVLVCHFLVNFRILFIFYFCYFPYCTSFVKFILLTDN